MASVQIEIIDSFIDDGYSYDEAYEMWLEQSERGVLTEDMDTDMAWYRVNCNILSDEQIRMFESGATIEEIEAMD